jgi:hypothetical protein
LFIIRFIIPLLIIGCSSIDEKSFGRVSFDNSFTAEHRFILSTCLSGLKQELYLSNLSIKTTTENINNLGLEFDSKSILTTNFETLDADEIFEFKVEEVSETNFLSSNMASNQSSEIEQVMMYKLCDHINRKYSHD